MRHNGLQLRHGHMWRFTRSSDVGEDLRQLWACTLITIMFCKHDASAFNAPHLEQLKESLQGSASQLYMKHNYDSMLFA